MRKPKLRELLEAGRALWQGPYTLPFPARVEPPPAGFRGKPQFVAEDCVACGACAEVCPAGALSCEDFPDQRPPLRRMTLRLDRCIFCGHCELNCLTERGIHLTPEYDLATFDRASALESLEKDLLLCEACGGVVATREHLRFISRQVGPRVYSNANLLLAREEALGLVEFEVPGENGGPPRADMARLLCPQCRRSLVAREIWG